MQVTFAPVFVKSGGSATDVAWDLLKHEEQGCTDAGDDVQGHTDAGDGQARVGRVKRLEGRLVCSRRCVQR